MRYWIGPWQWKSPFPIPGWYAPEGTVAQIDLRSTPHQIAQGTPEGVGIFVTTSTTDLGGDYTLIGDGSWEDIRPTGRERNALPKRPGYVPKGDTLREVLLDILTDGADPTGEEGPRPLIPTAHRELELVCGQVYREKFRWGQRHTNVILDVLQADFATYWASDQTKARKVLDDWCYKFQRKGELDWKDFVPPSLRSQVQGKLPRDTTISDNFDGADNAALGKQLTWTEVGGTGEWSNTGNRAYKIKAGANLDDRVARAEHDLSSADHYAQSDVVVLVKPPTGPSGLDDACQAGPACRVSTSVLTLYFYFLNFVRGGDNRHYMGRLVSGTYSNLAGPTSLTFNIPATAKIQANGSSITTYFDGGAMHSVTDTGITGNLRCGIYAVCLADLSVSGDSQQDNFIAEDLASGHPARKRMSGVRFAAGNVSRTPSVRVW